MKTFKLTDEQYKKLVEELSSLYGYHWRDGNIHADSCGSQVLDVIESQANEPDNFHLHDGGLYCDDLLLGEWDDGNFVPSRNLLEMSPDVQLKVDKYVRSRI